MSIEEFKEALGGEVGGTVVPMHGGYEWSCADCPAFGFSRVLQRSILALYNHRQREKHPASAV